MPSFDGSAEVIVWDHPIRADPMEAWTKPQLRVLLNHLATFKDARQLWKVVFPLDDIVDWGEAQLSFLRGFSEFHHGIPCADWLRTA
jgi:hypothetical protein